MKKNAFFPSCNKFVKGAGLSVVFAALLIFSNGAYAGKKTTLAKAGKSNMVSTKGNTAVGSDISRHPAASGNAYLSNLTISAGVLQFYPHADTLTVAEPSTVSSVTFTPTAYSSTAFITVNGTPVANGIASSPISLYLGDNEIDIAVTDSSSSYDYTIFVTQYPPVTISYSSPQTLYQGVSASLTPATSGATTFGLDLSLPPGLTFDNATGVISGVPTATSAATNYTVTAIGVAARASATVNIKVVTPPAPAISYSSPQTFYVDGQVAGLAPASSYVGPRTYYSAPTVFASGLTAKAQYLAQDAQGNFYVSNNTNGIIQEVPAGGGPPVTVFTATSTQPVLAVDAAGDIFESDGKNVYKILKGSSTATLVASGFTKITGMAIDPGGNIIVADKPNVEKILASNGQISTVVKNVGVSDLALDATGNLYISAPNEHIIQEFPVDGTPEVDIGLSFSPNLFSVDAAGDIFVGSGNNLWDILAGGDAAISLGASFTAPRGIVVAPSGNVYVADAATIKEIKLKGGYAITPALPAGLNFSNFTGVISGTPVTVSPATNYTVTATNVTATATATVNIAVTLPPLPTISYASPQTYFEGNIPPLTPTSTNVYPLHYSSTIGTVGSGFSMPTGVARDAAGNIYVADNGNNAVKKIPAGGGTPVVIGSGFSHPSAVALDAAGNVYVADYGNDVVKKIPAGGGAPITIGAGFSQPMGLAVDGAGNVFVADYGNNLVKKIPAGGGDPIIIGSGFSHPSAVAVDPFGNIFIADAGNNAIEEIQKGSNTPFTFFTASAPLGVAISPSGIIYVVNTGANNIEIVPGNGVPVYLTTIATGFNSPAGITIDGAGNVYIADKGNNAIKEIKPDGGYFISRFLPIGLYHTGLILNSYTGVINGAPPKPSPAQNYRITAYNISGSAAATLKIAVIAYPFLSNLAVSTGTLSPAFFIGDTSYSAAAGSAAAIKVTPTTSEPGLTITVNGAAVASGTESGPIRLSPGTNTISVVVTASDGVTKQTNTITVGKGSNNAYLSHLSLNGGSAALTPSFAFKTLHYDANVPNSTKSITVKPSLLDTTASLTVNGSPMANNTVSGPFALAAGFNYIYIVVTAPDGVTTKTYTISVIRAASTDAYLSNLKVTTATLSPAFAFKTFSYTSGVPNSTDSVTVTPTLLDTTATVTVNGGAVASKTASWPIALKVGPNTLHIVGTAQNGGTKQTYTLTITRAPSTDAGLAGLKLSTGTLSPIFATSTTGYTASVGSSTSSITVTPTTAVTTATVTVNGTVVASGTASAAIALNTGANTITTVVTAQDGATIKTYTINVNRAQSTDAYLSNLKVTTATLSPAFAFKTLSYTSDVPNSTSSVTLTPTLIDATASSLTVNGIAVANKAASGAIALAVGVNNINVTIIAQDGVTTVTYTIAITRASGGVDSYSVTLPIAIGTAETPALLEDGILVHPGISPNGDGIDDFLLIDNISQYPDNKLSIMNRSSQLIYEAKGYDNSSKVFDGHSNKNGQMQLPGTYFYQLDYTVNGITKHKTGFLVLKY